MNFWLASLATPNSSVSVKFTLLTKVKTYKEDGQWRSLLRMEYFLNNSLPVALFLWEFPLFCCSWQLSFSFQCCLYFETFHKLFPLQWRILRRNFYSSNTTWKPFQQTFSAPPQLSGYKFPMYIFELMWSNTKLKKAIGRFWFSVLSH